MPMMCAVSFNPRGKLYYADPGSLTPKVGDRVLVPTETDPEVATCIWPPQWVDEDVGGLPVLAGLAGDDDVARADASRRRRAQARVAAKRLAREHGLPMKIIGVDHVVSTNMFTVYFTADGRVDFRALVRDINRTLSARVELRQVSARDSARLQGGIGSCGRDLCCATFLTDFEPVSVRMAKDQNLSLNPMKISGACGRLMCCLRYEHPLYEQFTARMPAVGDRVGTADGDGRVVAHDVPREQVVVALDGGGRCACSKADICGSRAEFDAAHPSPANGADSTVPAASDSSDSSASGSEPAGSESAGSEPAGSEAAGSESAATTRPSARRRSRARRNTPPPTGDGGANDRDGGNAGS
jgi:cell fate regulator YaaT (PSP1 superfamily)